MADYDRFDLIHARKELGYSQALLSEILGVSASFLSKMENGCKPLNNQALTLISDIKDRKRGYSPTHHPKNAKKVNILALKTNKLRPRFSAKVKVSDISDAPRRVDALERWWFKEIHPRCVACVKACKQSARVVLACPQFSEIKESN